MRSLGGLGCDLALGETRDCPQNPSCGSVDCVWEDWTQWGGCSCSCDGGQRTRNRHIRTSPRAGGKPCKSSEKEQVGSCNTQKCSSQRCIDGDFGEWVDWGQCSASCGGGVMVRHRPIAKTANECGQQPEGKSQETRFCSVNIACDPPIDCEFSSWGSWSDCSSTCNGIKRRSRRVARYGRGDGRWCLGGLKETWPCNPSPHAVSPVGCVAQSAVDCILGDWSVWSICSASCGGGERTRSRDIAQHPSNGGMACTGALSELRECGRQLCHALPPVDCIYGEWAEWGACSKCGGERLRTRNIARYPQNGGKPCHNITTEEAARCPRKCHDKLFCVWGHWDDWSRCTATCGSGGKRNRRRYLELSNDANSEAPPPVQDMLSRYDMLYHRTVDLEAHHYQELLLSFSAGGLCLICVMIGVRASSMLCSWDRAVVGPQSSRPISRSWEGESRALAFVASERIPSARYQHLYELNETELPMVGTL